MSAGSELRVGRYMWEDAVDRSTANIISDLKSFHYYEHVRQSDFSTFICQ